MFGIVFMDFIKKECKLLPKKYFITRDNALSEMNDIVFDFIRNKEGDSLEHNLIHREPTSCNSWGWKNLPYGYVVCQNRKESYYRLTVYHKRRQPSLIFDNFSVSKVFSVDILYIQKKKEVLQYEHYSLYDQKTREYFKQNVLPKLLRDNTYYE